MGFSTTATNRCHSNKNVKPSCGADSGGSCCHKVVVEPESGSFRGGDAPCNAELSAAASAASSSSWHLQLILLALTVVTCYTTFWLPYPNLRPSHNHHHHNQAMMTDALRGGATLFLPSAAFSQQPQSGASSVSSSASSAHLWHARGTFEDATLYYQRTHHHLASAQQPQPNDDVVDPLQRYYAQQGFADSAWERYLTIVALALVLAWFVWEFCCLVQHRQQQQQAFCNNNNNNQKRIHHQQEQAGVGSIVGLDLEDATCV
mmetsp:Transcript_6813/g.13839  ORF Transcript_6813/g.13839 Transcript_6813/m.13839 type:complete len:261 (+) Transcript_6813:437-1219(+)|eukprot:CAMPEP_0168744538 /NCGR_PEP_ID=MMETSP0724-20121128/14144_1 /TAXON_ID=265536 /ORGANISM="Amphiprora sp., Strain CCMP467" /LENGTH=260 /DNA_ID=CAMNT_0008792203 /DNA_START=400 /DNA_END=1182 /DNA_ORIENTATION=-